MQTPDAPPMAPNRRLPIGLLLIVVLVVGLEILCTAGVRGYFRLRSDTLALGQGVMSGVTGRWDTRIELHLGWFTTHLLRAASHALKLPPEPRAVFASVNGIEAGLYELRAPGRRSDAAAVFTKADQAMERRGWQRVVGVVQDRELVAVYMPKRAGSSSRVECCVAVFNGRELIVESASGNIEPLLEMAHKHLDPALRRTRFALAK